MSRPSSCVVWRSALTCLFSVCIALTLIVGAPAYARSLAPVPTTTVTDSSQDPSVSAHHHWSAQGRWVPSGTSWWWRNPDGSWPTDTWGLVKGRYYYAGSDGYLVTGWLHDHGAWYYLDPSSAAMVTGMRAIGGVLYDFDASGAMRTGWQHDADGWRYYSSSGAQVHGWALVNSQWYYFANDGVMVTGWLHDQGDWYYLQDNGVMKQWTLHREDGTYFFTAAGRMVRGWFHHPDGWRLYDASGRRVTGWYWQSDRWYYLNPDDGLMLTGRHVIDGVAYTLPIDEGQDDDVFNPGAIISDAEMFDAGAMSEEEIRRFLHDKNPSCQPGPDGSACLRDYRVTTTDLTSRYCAPYHGAPNEDAASIIAHVSTACGINPRVLLVLVQKEQGLVLGSGARLTERAYSRATGFACPDGAGCSSTYAGFHSQLYYAASRLRDYGENPQSFRFSAGQTVDIAYNPNPSCGASSVTIANRATAALYNYTPYQPNEAALANMYEAGDACSTYGNRNFWRYYRDWFGGTGQ